MGDFISHEIDLFLQSAYYGMILGASYDVLRILRRVIRHKNVIVYIEDYLFWVVWGIMLFALIFNYNDGNVRWYVFGAVILGGILYEKSFSTLIVNILTFLLKKPIKTVRMIIIKLFLSIKKGLVRINGCFRKKKKGK